MRAVTDSGPTEPDSPLSEGVANIFTIMQAVSAPDTVAFSGSSTPGARYVTAT